MNDFSGSLNNLFYESENNVGIILELIMGLMELLQAIFDSKKQIKHDLRLKGKLSKDSKIILLIWLFAILFLGFVVWFDMVLMNS